MLTTSQLLHTLSKMSVFKNHFIHVGASDQLPSLFYVPAAIIANTDSHDLPGSHWIAFYAHTYENVEFFDSFGRAPFINHHIEFLKKHFISYTYNSRQVQSEISGFCGHYCLLYLFYRASGYTVRKLQLDYPNPLLNDAQLANTFLPNLK